ncbi:OmpP1/FadL family transporter [Paracoccus sp. P2]|uniref:Outer membrane protein transport protein n=1 Tax=Paracoccus pantotrophus TaxID=82367 RepID=A0A7H9BT67_PARPN|nr:outer membrane protein transport protein [Paracoccus pantotrophus]MDF3856381.1 outer membrane protein transport protein [Paracoccus pantotrophus]QLH14086.1 outer membrane protein transport protein [Paracoccus pantotrophus]
MNRTEPGRLAALAGGVMLTAILGAQPAKATNGYFANGYGGTSKGMAGAGVAIPTGVLGLAQNPATGTALPTQAGICLTGFQPERGFSIAPGGPLAEGRQTSDNSLFWIPCGGFNYNLDEQSSVAVFMFGNGGMNVEYGTNPFAGLAPKVTTDPLGINLEQAFISLNYARRLTPRLSVGLGPVLAVQRFSATGLEPFAGMSVQPGALTHGGDDWSTGLGMSLGLIYRLDSQWSLGASWRSRIDMRPFEDYAGLFADGGDFDIPAVATLGVAFRPSGNPGLTLTAEYQRIFYGSVESLANSGAMLAAPLGSAGGPGFGWQDMDVIRIAAAQKVNDRLTLRGGISHASSFIDDDGEVLLNILAPATPRWHASIGYSYRLSERATLTGSYTHAFHETESGANRTPGLGQQTTLFMEQDEISMGISWDF